MIDFSEWFYYDQTSPTGLRIKKVRLGGKDGKSVIVNVGDIAGCVQSDGYGKVSLKSKVYYAHRIVWEMHHGKIPDGMMVDHIVGDKRNYSLENLRLASPRENTCNKVMPSNNTSGVVGVRLYEKEVKGKVYSYWRAFWNNYETRKQEYKDFPVHKLGNEVAWDSACAYRNEKINSFVIYTERHGLDVLKL